MRKNLILILICVMAFVMVLGSAPVATAGIYQSKIIGIKQDPAENYSEADLNGRYWFRRLYVENVEATEAAQREAAIAYGYIDFDGQGGHTISFTDFDSDGETEYGSINGTYSVNSDGSFSLDMAGDPTIMYGHISGDAGRNFLILSDGGSYNSQAFHGIVVAVKTSSLLQISDLNGSWIFRNLQLHDFEKPEGDITICSITLNPNGSGNWEGAYHCFDSDGTSNSGQASGTYTLNSANRAFDIYITGESGVFLSGYLCKDEHILICSQGVIEPDTDIEQMIATALKMDPTKNFTNADLAGKFSFRELAIIDMLTSSRQASSSKGTIEFDGQGQFSGSYTSFWSDGTTESGSIAGTYLVNCDGSFTMTVAPESDNMVFYGNISSDGSTIVLNTPSIEGDVGPCKRTNPVLHLLLLDES